MEHLTPIQVASWLADTNRPAPVLLDVREPWEFDTARIEGATLIPMSTLVSRLAEIEALQQPDPARPANSIVCICDHGARSMQVAAFLERQGIQQLINMSGGIHGWSQQVDSEVPTY
jgi:rhodanese-related sulfurtransferase